MSKVKVYLTDTLTGEKVELKPVEPGKVKIYFCGPTVYDHCHIGHAKAYIQCDFLIRLLKYLGYEVKYIRNVTDIDDKIIKRAQREGKTPFEIAYKFYREFADVERELKLIPPDVEPFATAHIPDMIQLIQTLIDKGYAYVGKTAVWFHVPKFKDYGKLSKIKLKDLVAGARIEPAPDKKHPADFALWKFQKPGEPAWPSPWGPGRPGWHIECSAMVLKHLGETIDIHGGGADLIFPHHENEIAQSEAATGKPFANIWFHVGLLQIKKEKMSKSLGNIIPVKEVLKRYDAETIRYAYATTHFRKPLEFSWDLLDQAEKSLNGLYSVLFELEINASKAKHGEIRKEIKEALEFFKNEFINAMADDLNTPKALSVLHEMANYARKNMNNFNAKEMREFAKLFRELGWILGILQQSLEERIQEFKRRGKIVDFVPSGYIQHEIAGKFTERLIKLIVDVRSELRKRKMYDIADKIRDELRNMGIVLEDMKEGTRWKIMRI